jgi:hypothetical protein
MKKKMLFLMFTLTGSYTNAQNRAPPIYLNYLARDFGGGKKIDTEHEFQYSLLNNNNSF